jgi:hypothetical protein
LNFFRAGLCASEKWRNTSKSISEKKKLCVRVFLNKNIFPFKSPSMNILKRIIPTTPTSSTMLAYLVLAFLMVTTLQADEVRAKKHIKQHTKNQVFIQSKEK